MKIKINKKEFDVDSNAVLEDVVKKHFKETNIVAARVNSNLCDLSEIILEDSNIELISTNDKDGLEIMRHTCAHIFGHAIKQIYPDVQMVIGPVIENGFYYDILSKVPISEKELNLIENRMRKLSKKNYNIVREVVSKDKAISIFKDRNEPYKIEILKEISRRLQIQDDKANIVNKEYNKSKLNNLLNVQRNNINHLTKKLKEQSNDVNLNVKFDLVKFINIVNNIPIDSKLKDTIINEVSKKLENVDIISEPAPILDLCPDVNTEGLVRKALVESGCYNCTNLQ